VSQGNSSGTLHDQRPILSVAGHGELTLEITADCPAGAVLADWGDPQFT
jgi:hypothetical protein